ncbi:MAG: hypothetical protein ACRENE_21785 [Polyangiaceae bacterium]
MRRLAHLAIVFSVGACFSFGGGSNSNSDSSGGGCGGGESGGCESALTAADAGPTGCASAADCVQGQVCCATMVAPAAAATCGYAPCASGYQPCASPAECAPGEDCVGQTVMGVSVMICQGPAGPVAAGDDAPIDSTAPGEDAAESGGEAAVDAGEDGGEAASLADASDQTSPDGAEADAGDLSESGASVDAPSDTQFDVNSQ